MEWLSMESIQSFFIARFRGQTKLVLTGFSCPDLIGLSQVCCNLKLIGVGVSQLRLLLLQLQVFYSVVDHRHVRQECCGTMTAELN